MSKVERKAFVIETYLIGGKIRDGELSLEFFPIEIMLVAKRHRLSCKLHARKLDDVFGIQSRRTQRNIRQSPHSRDDDRRGNETEKKKSQRHMADTVWISQYM